MHYNVVDDDDDDDDDAASILWEPAQSKCTWTRHKRHLVRKFRWKMPDANPAARILCEPAQSKGTWTCHKRHFVRKFAGRMPYAYPATSVLCEPAPSKCTWTCHKEHFARKFQGKMPDASDTTSIEQRPLTVTVRTFQRGHTVWDKKHLPTHFFRSYPPAMLRRGTGFHAKGGTGETCQGLFSHADQQRAAETLTCQYSTAEFKGAGGRMADAVAAKGAWDLEMEVDGDDLFWVHEGVFNFWDLEKWARKCMMILTYSKIFFCGGEFG